MLYFYPKSIEIISRQVHFNLYGGILRRAVQEKISFQNKSPDNLKEIRIQIEHRRTDLRITDGDNNNIIYEEEKDNVLKLVLSKSMTPQDYGILFLNYVEYAKRTDDHAKAEINEMWYVNHGMYKQAVYYDAIDFYANEELRIFSEWEEPLELDGYGFYYYSKNCKSIENVNLENKNFRNNCISFSISQSDRKDKDVSMRLIYVFMPQIEQLRLIQVLTWFTFLFPFTEILSILLHNISYLFASIEVEVVLILTLAFTETRTRLILHRKFIIIALIITGVLFIMSIVSLIGII